MEDCAQRGDAHPRHSTPWRSGLVRMPIGVMAAGTDVSIFASGEGRSARGRCVQVPRECGELRNGSLEPLCTHLLDRAW